MLMRTEYCGLINEKFIDKFINLCGWVDKYRNHGKIIFIDLRDREGIVQIICNNNNVNIFKLAKTIRNEFCLNIYGLVRKRPLNNINTNITSGIVEILAYDIKILNTAIELPFKLKDKKISEKIRLKYRFLDLRRSNMQKNILLRHKITIEIRKFLNKNGFIDIETPFLTKSTPEGARDYLVPSRINSGNFFSLPQSPQIFKQLLMISSFDRYYQITKCFRDEDLRSDRQPEFTQIDCETSFLNEYEIRSLFEKMICSLFKKILNINLPNPFPVISFNSSILKYGSDKPDTRIKLKLVSLNSIINKINFNFFFNEDIKLDINNLDIKFIGMKIPNGINISQVDIEKYINICYINNFKNIFYFKIKDIHEKFYKFESSFVINNISNLYFKKITKKINGKKNDLIFCGIGKKQIIYNIFSILRLNIGYSKFSIKNNIFKKSFSPIWIVDFPMFKYNNDTNTWNAFHHPFTSPKDNHENLIFKNPELIIAKSYDMIINGCEVGGGSIRIHKAKIQKNIFKILSMSKDDINLKFGFLINALKFGAPPHGGIAFGLDRLISIMIGAKSIREVIAFPKTQQCQCLLTKAPSFVQKSQLKDLKIFSSIIK